MKNIIICLLMLTTFALQAQEKDKYLPKGNEEFASKNYVDAEANYRISQAKFAKKSKSSYNLGTSIYKQNQPEEAKYQFARAIQDAKTKSEKHSAFHNFGNTLMKEKNYEGAVQAYKDALRNNPSDEQTRYNYALAKKMLKDHPPKNDDKKDKDKNKDKKDEKDKEKDKDKKDDNKDKNKDKKDGDDKKDKQDKPQPKPSGANKQRIDNLLDAVSNEEKKVQEKVNAQKVQGKPQKPEKDW
ncbi:tetratricopeptide repeat protein [Flavobacterium aquatile]|uniref:BatC protein n=1 Tax=Flavobacterium aquatile LMG 4008 = ATCC 11947 TaxID=1453498 RepID=A0A095UX04_9FLAO|nr:tetratricopeptide repeat protein [Flavobacterium aquatile]KGD67070.1 BatC protein [Flavobacterium aquatile LMG 4008 = ATCC 11947]OXA66769.1 BatC protein [Flavobacterium aquatile] [Flavobacterium aquatile LMG 4008 = ATCC 11947]